jgi:SNF2 family DNA or RNA helicase
MMYNPKMMEQSITRAHRLGGSDRTLVSLLITSNTVDEHIFTKIIGGKAELIEALNVAGDIEAMMKEQPQDFIPGRRTK